MPHRKRRRELASNTLWSMADEAIVLVVSIVSLLALVPNLGREQYGAYAALFALIGPLTAFPQSGVSLAVFDHTMRANEDVDRVARSCMSIATILSLIITPACIALGIVLFTNIDAVTVILFMVTEVLVQSVWITFTTVVQVAHRFRSGVLLRIGSQVVRVSVILCLLVADSLTLGNLALANAIVLTGRLLVALLIARSFNLESILPGRMERAHVRSTFTYSLGISASTTSSDGDKVVLGAAGYHTAAGEYAAGQRIVAMAMLPLNALTTSAHFDVLKESSHDNDQRRKALQFTRIASVYAIPAAVMLVIGAPLVPWLIGEEWRESVDIIRVLAPVIIIRGLCVFPMNGLLALGRNPLRTRILLATAALSLVLYVALIPTYSWRGAVVATLISEVAVFITAWVALVRAQRRYDRDLATEPATEVAATADDVDLEQAR